MHQLITVLVPAHTEDEALSSARSALDALVGIGFDNVPVFDYYKTFDHPDARFKRTVAKAIGDIDEDSANTELVDVPVAFSLSSPEGEALLDHMQKIQRGEYEKAFETVEEKLEDLTAEDVMNGVDGIRYHLSRLAEYEGPSVYLYNEFGGGLSTPSAVDAHVDRLQNAPLASDGGDIDTAADTEADHAPQGWIVPADVHY